MVEEENSFDQHAVAVPKDGGVVGQVPRELARIGLASYLLKYCTVPHATVCS